MFRKIVFMVGVVLLALIFLMLLFGRISHLEQASLAFIFDLLLLCLT